MDFNEQIKTWVTLDNKIRDINNELKEMRDNKNKLMEQICLYVNENNLNHAVVKTSDSTLKFQNIKTTKPLTMKYINDCLINCIDNKEQIEYIMKYIKEHRESSFSEIIKRNFT